MVVVELTISSLEVQASVKHKTRGLIRSLAVLLQAATAALRKRTAKAAVSPLAGFRVECLAGGRCLSKAPSRAIHRHRHDTTAACTMWCMPNHAGTGVQIYREAQHVPPQHALQRGPC